MGSNPCSRFNICWKSWKQKSGGCYSSTLMNMVSQSHVRIAGVTCTLFFQSDWNQSNWRFRVNCLRGMWSNTVRCLHAPTRLIRTAVWRAKVQRPGRDMEERKKFKEKTKKGMRWLQCRLVGEPVQGPGRERHTWAKHRQTGEHWKHKETLGNLLGYSHGHNIIICSAQ